MSIKITTDSACDLTDLQLERYGIDILPLHIRLGNQSLLDRIEVNSADIFQYVDDGLGFPKTASVNVAEFYDVFHRLSQLHEAVIHVAISSPMSSCYQNALIAAEEFSNVYVIDSGSLSAGQGLICVAGMEAYDAGMPADQVAGYMQKFAEKVETSFILGRLDYMVKGGRCTSIAVLGANMLHLKPCIESSQGNLFLGKKYRGSFSRCLCDYARDRICGRQDLDLRHCYVVHPDAPREALDAVLELIPSLAQFEDITEIRSGCTVSSHCGPETVGIMFARK